MIAMSTATATTDHRNTEMKVGPANDANKDTDGNYDADYIPSNAIAKCSHRARSLSIELVIDFIGIAKMLAMAQ